MSCLHADRYMFTGPVCNKRDEIESKKKPEIWFTLVDDDDSRVVWKSASLFSGVSIVVSSKLREPEQPIDGVRASIERHEIISCSSVK